ncbi:DUF4339 domain-containing protein [Acerihabitans arboris]|uniref:DUF4339 domain-containing protein n=1 Tax=Acerihabitans arboris TaxID=2691583 RepID=A0A845SG64_9GAMM|nr:DUF4339 domain-containing protein [Acerihabitans arboris]NDL62317.1 DUF4339 domain-containing protein [Acerihabitans arboris]
MARWWYIAGNKQQGPVTLPTIKRLLKRQVLGAHSIVWREGFRQWTRLDASAELQPLLKTTPPPLPRAPGAAAHAAMPYPNAESKPAQPQTQTPGNCRWLAGLLAMCCLTFGAYLFYPQHLLEQMVVGVKTLTPSLTQSVASATSSTASATLGENQWQNPVTLKQANLEGWTVKQLSTGEGSVASSFISDNAVVNFSVAAAKNQTLNALVNYLKTNESALRFVNQGIYSHTGGLPNWTGIATSTDDHDKSYVVHVTNAPDGYGILIAAINQQTANSVSRLEALMTKLDQTFKGN